MFASCARAAAARLRANAAALSERTGAAANNASRRRGFASGSSGGHDDHGVTYEGVTLHKPARWHSAIGTGMASLMWCVFLKGERTGVLEGAEGKSCKCRFRPHRSVLVRPHPFFNLLKKKNS